MKAHEQTPAKIDYCEAGRRLKSARKQLHCTQEQIAEIVGVTPAFIGHIERGERGLSLDTLLRLCSYYGITLDYVFAADLPPDEDNAIEQFRDLVKDKTAMQKIALLDILRAVARYLQ